MTPQPTDPSPAATPQLELRGIVKQYPGTLANDNVNLTVMPGEVHALLGENGAGKSTLVKIIYGLVQADTGEFLWNGERLTISNPGCCAKTFPGFFDELERLRIASCP